MTGFEPATSCSQSRRATKLRYIPDPLVLMPSITCETNIHVGLIIVKQVESLELRPKCQMIVYHLDINIIS